jgi:ADP-ribosylation factor related protein 1
MHLTFFLVGQEELQALWDKYYSDCHAIVYVVDSSDRARLEETRDAFGTCVKEDQSMIDEMKI